MRIRSTECEHEFTKRLFDELGAYSLQGLTMSSHHGWTAAIEAIQFDDNEDILLDNIFDKNSLRAKFSLANVVNVPFFIIAYKKGTYNIYEVSKPRADFILTKKKEFCEEGFIDWWRSNKGTEPTKDFNNGAQNRADRTIFDVVLERHGLSWGGNIDGFIFRKGKLGCIIENIYTYRHPLDTPEGEPSKYFFKRGPNYNTWYSSVKLAYDLSVPLFLFTINGNTNKERIGFTIIDHLNSEGIYYKDDILPNDNVISRIKNIVNEVNSHIATIPYIEKDGYR